MTAKIESNIPKYLLVNGNDNSLKVEFIEQDSDRLIYGSNVGSIGVKYNIPLSMLDSIIDGTCKDYEIAYTD